jgi:hypothetical protein
VSLTVVGVLVAAGVVPAALASVGATSASWTDGAYLVSAASSGSWTAGLGTCQVVSSTAPYDPVTPAPACTITSITYSPFNDGKPVGSRHANMYFTASASVGKNQIIKVTLNLAAAAGIPSNWNFATSGVDGSSVSAYPGYKCSDLASGVFVGLAPAWAGGNSSVYLGQLVENRAETGHTYTCA